MLGHDDGGEELNVSIPLGGPIYVPDIVGPLTRVPHFETSAFQELQVLHRPHIKLIILCSSLLNALLRRCYAIKVLCGFIVCNTFPSCRV